MFREFPGAPADSRNQTPSVRCYSKGLPPARRARVSVTPGAPARSSDESVPLSKTASRRYPSNGT
jgi:hypothetical protein